MSGPKKKCCKKVLFHKCDKPINTDEGTSLFRVMTILEGSKL